MKNNIIIIIIICTFYHAVTGWGAALYHYISHIALIIGKRQISTPRGAETRKLLLTILSIVLQ